MTGFFQFDVQHDLVCLLVWMSPSAASSSLHANKGWQATLRRGRQCGQKRGINTDSMQWFSDALLSWSRGYVRDQTNISGKWTMLEL